MNSAPLKVSYCTTCRGRLPHLKQTLPANLAAEKDNPNVEFVVLDYGDEGKDGNLGEWIKQTFPEELATGRLRCARYEAPHFVFAHSRNMAHRLATGDILCNVDADNFIAPNFSRWLAAQLVQQPNGIVHGIARDQREFTKRAVDMLLKRNVLPSNMGGRMAMTRQTFEDLGGYDEINFNANEGLDKNLAMRADVMGLPAIRLPENLWGDFIAHGNEARFGRMSQEDRRAAEKRIETSMARKYVNGMKFARTKFDPVANVDGDVGCGTVVVNFQEHQTRIGPLPGKAMQESVVREAAPTEPAQRRDWVATHGTSVPPTPTQSRIRR